nr:hypothetical protein BaRGS_008782 [Batillaria attramentaria]
MNSYVKSVCLTVTVVLGKTTGSSNIHHNPRGRLMNLTEDEVPSHLPLTLAPDYQYLLMNPNLCGSVPNATLQALLEAEHRLYGDTLQGHFHDHYHNLSQKGVMGFNWITHYCPHVRYVFKMDDDAFVDTFKLLNKFLPLFDGKRRAFICNPWINNTMGILRTGKWKVDDHLFRGLRRYPFTYCSGFAMGITGDLIPSLYQAAFFAPFFWIDDVYLYGILPFLAGNVKYYVAHPLSPTGYGGAGVAEW